MYLSFYQLKHKPFEITTDPRFLWLGERHEEALATLRYGVQDNKGFLLLTGDVGTGKTTLINALLRTVGKDTIVASIRDPALDPIDFFNYTAHTFGIKGSFTSKTSFLIQFERFLYDADSKNKRVLLIIDEAQRISQSLLDEVRVLSNIEKENSKLLNIFFIGQLEFNDIILRPENKAIRQRITINYNITALTEQETGRYIKHRLEVAGAEEEILSFGTLQEKEKGEYVKHVLQPPEDLNETFTYEAVKEIFSFSKGYPRLINIICDRCLLTGFVEGSSTITHKHVQECARELTIPQSEQNKNSSEKVSDELEKEAVTPPPENTSAVPGNAPEELRTKEKVNSSKNMIFATAGLLLLLLCYFGLSKFVIPEFQGNSSPVSTQDLRQQLDKNEKEAVPDKATINIPSQPVSLPVSKVKNTNQEEKQASITILENRAKELKKENLKEINEAVVEEIDPNKSSLSPLDLPQGTAEANRPPDTLIVDQELLKPKINQSVPQAIDSVQEKQPANKDEQIPVQEIQVKSLVTFEKLTIPFPSNSNFPPNSLDSLNMLVKVLLKNPSYNVIITGFTDSEGNEAFNEKLSEFRANTIKSYLVGRGLKESQILTQGFGSRYPVASNDTFSGRMANRRVEIVIDR